MGCGITLWKLRRFLKDYKLQLILGPLFKLIEAVFELIVPLVMADIIDNGAKKGDAAYVWRMGLVMAALGISGWCFAIICQKSASIASQGFGTKLRTELYKHINSLSHKEIDKFGTSSLITRMTNDINQLQLSVAMLIRLVTRSPFLIIGAIVMSTIINFRLAIVVYIATPFIAFVLYFIMTRSVPFFKMIQKKLDKTSLLTGENLSGNRVIRAFSKQKSENDKFYEATEDLAKISLRVGRLSALLNPLTYLIVQIAIIAIVWFSGGIVYTGSMTQGEVIALVNYMTQIYLAMAVLANLIVIFTKASASAIRVSEVFETEPSVKEYTKNPIEINPDAPKIEFKDVSFAYDGDYDLRNISFSVQKGQTVGIIGGTGSGKSTLINLIPRFYDVSKGEILIDGVNVKDYSFRQLRKQMGIVPQKSSLVSGTVKDNMLWGNKDATDNEIISALKTAQAWDFISKSENGINSVVNQGGKNFSGGQKQRLTIARAIVSKPQILILDDSSSALDFATEANLRRALNSNIEDTTKIIVSQRVSSIKNSDLIIVLDDGDMVGIGTHKELLENCETYREICSSQLSEKEASV